MFSFMKQIFDIRYLSFSLLSFLPFFFFLSASYGNIGVFQLKVKRIQSIEVGTVVAVA